MTTFEYRRIDRWMRSESHGWASADVAARFEAGTRGEHYLEYLPFGPGITEQPAAKELLDLLSRTGLDRAVLLDFGCGNGVFRELLKAAEQTSEWTYIGADVNPLSIESCRKRFSDCRFEVVVEGTPLPLDDESVDIVVASGVLESIEEPGNLLAEFGRVTRRWVGLCRLGVRPTAPAALYWQAVRHAWGFEEHCFHVFNRKDLDRMVARARLETVWEDLSLASGEWLPPDDPVPLQHFSFLLRKT